MFKYLPLLALCALPVIAADQQNATLREVTEDTVQPLAQSIALIMANLEKGIRMLDNPLLKDPRATEIIAHLVNADTIAQEQLIKLIALLKIKKLADAGITIEQLQQFAKTFNIFHTKFCAFKKQASLKTPASEAVEQSPTTIAHTAA